MIRLYLILIFVIPCTSACSTLSSWNQCYQVLNYTVDDTKCQADADFLFDTTAYGSLSPSCRVAVSRVQCAQRYPPCYAPTATLPPYLCQDITTSCTSLTDRTLVNGMNVTQPWTCSNNVTDTAQTSPYQFVATTTTIPPAGPTCFMLPSTSLCAAYITTPVMLPYNATLASQQAFITSAQQADIILGGEPCHSLYYQTVCRDAYLPCRNITFQAVTNNTGVPVTLTYSTLPCRSLCINMLSTCPSILGANINCSSPKTISSCSGGTLASYDIYPDPITSIPWPTQASLVNATSNTLANVPMICSTPDVPTTAAPTTSMPTTPIPTTPTPTNPPGNGTTPTKTSALTTPTPTTSSSPNVVCGDGFVQGSETCDCGYLDCTHLDPCCNGLTCQRRTSAQCSSTGGNGNTATISSSTAGNGGNGTSSSSSSSTGMNGGNTVSASTNGKNGNGTIIISSTGTNGNNNNGGNSTTITSSSGMNGNNTNGGNLTTTGAPTTPTSSNGTNGGNATTSTPTLTPTNPPGNGTTPNKAPNHAIPHIINHVLVCIMTWIMLCIMS